MIQPPDEILRVLVEQGVTRQYPARTILLTEEDQGDSLYVILKGRIKAYGATDDGREVVYSVLGEGELFGELCLDGGERSASVMTLSPTTCAVIPAAHVRRLILARPDVATFLLMRVVRMLRRITSTAKQLALGDASHRLTELLGDLAREDTTGRLVVEGYTQQDLAERIGCSREMVSRIMKRLTSAGDVQCERRRIVLRRRGLTQ